MKKIKDVIEIFLTTFTISATASSGYAILAAMKKKFVDNKNVISAESMADCTALAQSVPGPMAVSGSVVIGYQLAGPLGSIAATIGTIIPPIIIMTLVYYFYEFVVSSQLIALAFKGMQASVCALIISITYDNFKAIIDKKSLFFIMLILVSYALMTFLNVSIVFVLFGSAIAAVLYCKGNKEVK